jgi:opacity protein-like surface antigen
MKKTMLFLSVAILAILVLWPASVNLSAAPQQDVMAGHWVLKFDDGREGWANLVSDDYAKTGFSSKGKIEVPGFKKVDITSGVVPDFYKVGQVILYNPQSTQNPFHFVRFTIEGNRFMTGYVATFDSRQYRFKAHRR